MPVTEILLLRHGYRAAWSMDPTTGKYTSNHPNPTRLPADPPLVSHGVDQAEETGTYLAGLLEDRARRDCLRVYSSLFYRCLQTLRPTITKLQSRVDNPVKVRGETGFGEWFGHAWFEQPSPASPSRLKNEFFPFVEDGYQSLIVPDKHGEYIPEIHDRVAQAFSEVIASIDTEYEAAGRSDEQVTLLICGHAAQIICSGRVLTGAMPDDPDEDDFQCFTCGVSKFVRRTNSNSSMATDWKGHGVAGGWNCIWNSSCEHLSGGEERGWHFHGDESFDSYSAGAGRDPIIEDGGLPGSAAKL